MAGIEIDDHGAFEGDDLNEWMDARILLTFYQAFYSRCFGRLAISG